MSKTPDPVDVHVGARLRYRRMLIGKSQEALGEELGLTFQQIQKYEKGQNRIGASRLYYLARALDVPVDFFFEALPPTGFASGEASPLSFVASQEGMQLNIAFSQIADESTRRKVLDLVRALASGNGNGNGSSAAS